MKNEENMIFRQLFDPETSTYTYVLADPETMEGVIIDPVIEKVDRDLQVIKELGLKLLYTIETHVHADHVTASGNIRKKTGAKSVIGPDSGVDCADIYLGDDEIGWCIFFLNRQNRPCGAIVELIRRLEWYREQIKALQ